MVSPGPEIGAPSSPARGMFRPKRGWIRYVRDKSEGELLSFI